MTAVSNSRRCALMKAYLIRILRTRCRLPTGPPLVLTITPKVSAKAWEVHRLLQRRTGDEDFTSSKSRAKKGVVLLEACRSQF